MKNEQWQVCHVDSKPDVHKEWLPPRNMRTVLHSSFDVWLNCQDIKSNECFLVIQIQIPAEKKCMHQEQNNISCLMWDSFVDRSYQCFRAAQKWPLYRLLVEDTAVSKATSSILCHRDECKYDTLRFRYVKIRAIRWKKKCSVLFWGELRRRKWVGENVGEMLAL